MNRRRRPQKRSQGHQGSGFWTTLFAPVRAYYRWADRRQELRKKIIAYIAPPAAILAVIIIAASAGWGGDGDGDEAQRATIPQAAKGVTELPQQLWPNQPVTKATVQQALDDMDNLGLREDMEGNIGFLSVMCQPDGGGCIIAIEFKPGTAWSETDMLTVAGGSTVCAMAKLFANPGVERVKVSAMADLTDQYGNESTEFVTTATINRATVNMINWEGLANRQLLDNKHIFCIADEFVIRPVIYNKLKDKGCLPGPSGS